MSRKLIPMAILGALFAAAAAAQSSGQQIIVERAGAAPARPRGLRSRRQGMRSVA
jgi:hypothetical protein